MRYWDAVRSAPPGSATFAASDLARLSPPTLRLIFHPGRAAPPLEDVAAALGQDNESLQAVATRIDPKRGERLLRLSMRPATDEARREAATRLVRGTFWPLVYELAPDRWEALAEAEPVSRSLLAALPVDGAAVVEVAAGGGRLSRHIAPRAAGLALFDGSLVFAAHLRDRFPRATVACALTHQLPLPDACADVVTACGAMSPDPPLGGEAALAELERVVRPGGWLALVAPERPQWFENRGFRRQEFDRPAAHPPADVVAFFGPVDPPCTLVTRRRPG